MRNEVEMKFECIFEEPLAFIDIDYTHLNKTVRYEQRPHGEWERIDKWVDGKYVGGFIHKECPMIKISDDCLYSPWTYNFCPNCGAKMISSNSEIEKSKSEIIPDYRDGWRLRGEAE